VLLTQTVRLKLIKIKLLCWKSHYNYIFKIILNWKSKFRGPLSQATASKYYNALISLYTYQKDERAKPEKLLTKRCSLPTPQYSVSDFSQDVSILSTLPLCNSLSICVRMVLTINSDCFPKQHYPVALCSADVICFLWGTISRFCPQSVCVCSAFFWQ
jgi:ABC-type transport system involved in Fe-S cluster assembly fused permease/ATPase subunit